MTLADYLQAHDLSFAAFGERIGRSRQAVERYAKGSRIPDRDAMAAIVRETEGRVDANSFYPPPGALNATEHLAAGVEPPSKNAA